MKLMLINSSIFTFLTKSLKLTFLLYYNTNTIVLTETSSKNSTTKDLYVNKLNFYPSL